MLKNLFSHIFSVFSGFKLDDFIICVDFNRIVASKQQLMT